MSRRGILFVLSTSFLGLCIFVHSAAMGHERVVVIPLGGKQELHPSAQSFTNSIGMGFHLIPAGTFMMGSPETEIGRDNDETQHQVTISQPFYIQTTEVTQAQWEAIATDPAVGGANPSYFSGEGHPVEIVNWYEAASFANWLSVSEGRTPCYNGNGTCTGTLGVDFSCTEVTISSSCTGYRLPTEAQWEYAARAGTSTAFYNGNITSEDCTTDPNLDEIGWYCGNADSSSHIASWKQPNDWGLYDMSGNVWEWCQDWYDNDYYSDPASSSDPQGPASGSDRVVRGGGWDYNARGARSANRGSPSPGYRSTYLGFRLVLPPGQ